MNLIQKSCGLIVLVIALSGLICAQEIWRSKPFREWTKEDIIRLSSDSPWAQVRQADFSTGERTPAAYLPGITLRLRSALPIRQALLRLKQIEAKYDKMNEKERAEFDARMKGMIECPACADNYVVSLGPPVTKREMKSGVGSLRDVAFGLLEGKVYLANERGERRELVHFIPPKHDEDEATFFFPRLDAQGHPLLTPENKRLIFFFEARNLRTGYGLDPIPSRIDFDVSKMIVDGKVEF